MIYDNMEHAAMYAKLNSHFARAIEFMAGIADVENGRHDLGDGMFANVQNGTTRDIAIAKFEAHRKFIDIQFIIEGATRIGVKPVEALKPTMEFQEKDDYCLYEGEGSIVDVKPGEYCVFFPGDGHMPHVYTAGESSVPYRIAIIKVPVE